MTTTARVSQLNEYLGAALSASNRIVAEVHEPAEICGLSCTEHRVLLLLSETDGMPEPRVAEQLHVATIAPTLGSLERKRLIERDRADGSADVRLTRDGVQVRDLIGTQEVSSRFNVLKNDIVALRDMLHQVLDLFPEESAAFRAPSGLA